MQRHPDSKVGLFALARAVLCALVLLAAGGADAQSPEFRAYWVDAWHDGFKTPAQTDALLAHVRSCNLNAVVVQMRRRGDTYYPSPYEPYATDATPGFDALAYLVQRAHNVSPRIEVHVWFTMLPIASDNTPSDPNHPFNRYPEYLTREDSGNMVIGGNYWFDPGHPGAEEYTYNVVMDVVNRYDVDGVHFDYIRFGSQRSGYNEVSVARFNAFHGLTGQPAYTDSQWSNWRRAQITNLVRKIYANAITVKPNIKVSAATITWSPPAVSTADWPNRRPYYQVFQDWRAWMEEGILDLNIPMNYYECAGQDPYYQDFYTWLCFILNHQYNRAAAVGLGICNQPASCIIEHIGAIRNPSMCGAVPSSYGYCGYSYACGDLGTVCSLNPTRVSIPEMPWKTSPTKGHIKGTVTRGSVTWVDGASVTLTGPVTRIMNTDGTGFYAFIDLPPDNYTVTASKAGYGTKAESASVTAGAVTTANIQFTPPPMTISNVQAGGETSSTVTITWTTNLASTSQVLYGADRNCSNATPEDAGFVTNHSVTLQGLQPLTPYFYRVVSRDPDGLFAMSDVYAFVTGPSVPDIIIDNQQATFVESWASGSSATDKYGPDYRYCSAGITPVRYAYFTPNLPTAGNYRVYAWYPQGSNRTAAAPYVVNYSGGSETFLVDQRSNGGQWNLLTTRPFAAGASGSVTMHNSTSTGNVMADAVRFLLQHETTPPTVPQNLQGQAASHEQVNLSWTASTDASGVAGYRIYRDGAVVGASAANSYADVDLAGNTRYTYQVEAYDIWGNRSGLSGSVSVRTLSVPPSYATITCSREPGVWHTQNPFVFTAVGGFGPGTVAYYSYAWDTSPSHEWTGQESTWSTPTRTLYAASGPDPYYLHVRGFNSDGVPGGSADLGPFYLDETPPPAPVVVDDGAYQASQTEVHAVWNVTDPESGVCGYEYAVGTTQGGTDILGWTPTADAGVTAVIPAQAPGTTLYVSVRARNCADTWGPAGYSDGITIGVPLGSVAEIRALEDGTAVSVTAIVSAVFSDCLWVQDSDRTSGIRVELAAGFAVGDVVNASGVLATVSGERRLTQASVQIVP